MNTDAKDEKDLGKLLSDPFEASDVEWRVQQSGMKANNEAWAMLIPYITSRAVQQRLDDVFGVAGWKNEFKATEDGKGYLCGISFLNNGEWITKWDGAEFTNIESLKGALSGATKRSAVQMGIGRYLYHLETVFVTCKPIKSRFDVSELGTYIEIPLDKKNKNSQKIPCEWLPPAMPDWALPSVEIAALMLEITNASDVITLRSAYSRAYKYANSFNRGSLVKQIVELKDARKLVLTKESNSEDEADLKKVLIWLERAVTDEIASANNESVLKLAKKRLAKGIHERCMEKVLDVVELLQILEKRYTTQLVKLTGSNYE